MAILANPADFVSIETQILFEPPVVVLRSAGQKQAIVILALET